jgi:ABC-type sugar transport system substrate-binding protein
MKKAFFAALVAVLALALLAPVFAGGGGEKQSSGGSSSAAAPAKSSGLKVASHNAVYEGNAYRAVYEDQMKEQAEKLRQAGIISQFATFISNNDSAVESQYIEQTINEGYDIILVNPIAATGLDPVIAKAIAAGITYVNADCVYPHKDVVNVVVDQAAWAKIQSDFVIKTLKAGQSVVVFIGIDGNSASEIRNETWTKALNGANIKIARKVAHNWNDVDSKRLMGEIIASGLKFDGIINQEAANGILDAIQEAKRAYPGCITSSEEVVWIRRIAKLNESKLVLPFIVVENPPGIGATALAIAVNLRQGSKLKVAKDIEYTPQWVMTYDNMKDRLDSIKNLPDSTSVSSYMTLEQAKAAYFN